MHNNYREYHQRDCCSSGRTLSTNTQLKANTTIKETHKPHRSETAPCGAH